MEWPPGQLRETSGVFLLSNLWLPDWGPGMRQGESRACGPRVVGGECSRTLPSGCPTAFTEWVSQEGSQTESLLGILLQVHGECWCVLAGSPTSSFGLLQPWPAPLPTGHFFGSAVGEIGPPPTEVVWAFPFSFMFFFNYYLRDLGSLALATSPRFLSLEEKKKKYFLNTFSMTCGRMVKSVFPV